MRKWFICLLSVCFISASAQTAREIEKLIVAPRNVVSLPEDYYALRAGPGEQETFDSLFYNKMPLDVVHTLHGKKMANNDMLEFVSEQSAIPYVQLDTASMVKYKRNMYGY
ncbi:MAG: hypothetical protein JST82_07180 [Bacteroidetes bacterium]|nr:hypothetical protein [Bacteroidota bacterium]